MTASFPDTSKWAKVINFRYKCATVYNLVTDGLKSLVKERNTLRYISFDHQLLATTIYG